jgi:hypothetical protein
MLSRQRIILCGEHHLGWICAGAFAPSGQCIRSETFLQTYVMRYIEWRALRTSTVSPPCSLAIIEVVMRRLGYRTPGPRGCPGVSTCHRLVYHFGTRAELVRVGHILAVSERQSNVSAAPRQKRSWPARGAPRESAQLLATAHRAHVSAACSATGVRGGDNPVSQKRITPPGPSNGHWPSVPAACLGCLRRMEPGSTAIIVDRGWTVPTTVSRDVERTIESVRTSARAVRTSHWWALMVVEQSTLPAPVNPLAECVTPLPADKARR